ncbi:MAG TPA: hypothetical protein VGM76_13995 [Lacipirellulaceae bacterium]|jgi:hypothetical protein
MSRSTRYSFWQFVAGRAADKDRWPAGGERCLRCPAGSAKGNDSRCLLLANLGWLVLKRVESVIVIRQNLLRRMIDRAIESADGQRVHSLSKQFLVDEEREITGGRIHGQGQLLPQPQALTLARTQA